jgi:hypothetical protein
MNKPKQAEVAFEVLDLTVKKSEILQVAYEH